MLAGFGFGARETVKAYWEPGNIPLDPSSGVSTTLQGTFSGASAITFTVPLSPTGTYEVVAVGQRSHAVAVSAFHLLPALYATPTSGAHGSQATVIGTGFKANDMVSVKWDCATATCTSSVALGSQQANASGDVALKVTIPAAAVGVHALGGIGSPSGAFATTTYTVTS